MKIPEIKEAVRYTGLYIIDFGESCSVGFTAEEVAEILESEKYKDCKVYKIHRAYPDGRLEIKGVRRETFQLEAGMLFFSSSGEAGADDFKKLVGIAVSSTPPCNAKVHLAKYSDSKFVTAVIYPAEYDDQVSRWLLDNNYHSSGAAAGGISAVERYYSDAPQILERHQLFGSSSIESRSGAELLANLKVAVQR